MSVTLAVVEISKSGESTPLGLHDFFSIPSPGDRLVLPPAGMGDLEIMEVLYVEHAPVPQKMRELKAWKDSEPKIVAIYVKPIWMS